MDKQTQGDRPYTWRHLLKGFWRLARPYWVSEERAFALGLLAVVLALTLASVYLLVQFNTWNQQFYNAVQKFDLPTFWSLLLKFGVLAAFYILVGVLGQYASRVLQNRWRRWMTRRFLDAWLSDKSHYLWQLGDKATDNPDQRIAEDVRDFVNQSLGLSVGLVNQVVTLASFVTILWALSGPLAIPLGGGRQVSLPGYMAWACLVYAIVGTWLSHRIGKPLIGLNFRQQRHEADFRFGLVRLRENGESVALSDGERAENRGLRAQFEWVFDNYRALIRRQMQLGFFSVGYDQIAIIFPLVVAAPRYFAKTIGLGGLFQVANAFGQVKDSLSWVVANYPTLAYWRSVVERLEGFESEVERTKQMRQQALAVLGASPARGPVSIRGLSLTLPGQAQPLAEGLSVEFKPGRSVLISGPSGCGKSTLLRAVSGLWPFSRGRVLLPKGESVMVLPQRPYLPVGSLRAALAYPGDPADWGDPALLRALDLCRLGHLRGRLDETQNWALMLSMGEQQRVAWARVFLAKPRWLFLDEATSALDEGSQRAVYTALKRELPKTTMVSVAHRHEPEKRHRRTWAFPSQV